ncbi:serine protease [Pseudonocardiaceae bacterium YIM PH 21723]|nr:serine protease [Pseudonocardiaceae bacterium YIM PH 21723]
MRMRALVLGALLTVAAPVTALASPGGERIVGGHNATETYSFVVSLQNSGGSHFCGGSLIKPNWVVTAKHCVSGQTAGNINTRIGSNNRTSGGQTAKGSRIVTHPSSDLALLQLATSVTLAPATIPAASGADGTATRIIGWGQTCPQSGCSTPLPTTLQELDTTIFADSKCSGINGATEICTSNPGGNAGACYGDSGGPQIRKEGTAWVLIGATSRAGNNNPTCATGPSIYVDVPAHAQWITQQTG